MTRGIPYIGTSGWAYREWRGKFYPKGLPQKDELKFLAEHLPTTEMNGTFYRIQQPTMYQKWLDASPDDFIFAVKGWRGVTHFKKLRDAGENVETFLNSGVLSLGKQLGPILWQVPPSLKFDAEVLDSFFASLPTDNDGIPLRYAFEPRNASFATEEAYQVLEKHDVALVMADSAGKFPEFDQVTASFVYVRLHGSPRMYYSNYSQEALEQWAGKMKPWLADGRDVYVYFDNTAAGWAPQNAEQLLRMTTDEDDSPAGA